MTFRYIAGYSLPYDRLDQEHIEPAKPAREHVTPYMLVYTAKSKHG